jgi:protease-4
MSYSLISSLLHSAWAIDPIAALGYGNFVAKLLSGESVQLRDEASHPYVAQVPNESDPETKSNVFILPVEGPLTKNGGLCSMGTAHMAEYIKAADAAEDIDAIILKMDTPGGTVNGTEVFANAVANTRKHVTAYIDGMAASAGMWIASQADKIVASTEHDQVGSIGVMVSFADMQPKWEKEGIKFHTIRSDYSADKNKDFDNIRAGNYEEYIKEHINPLAEKFHQVIRDSRPNITDDLLTGKMYFAKNVTGSLIDEIKTMDTAIYEAAQIAYSNNQPNTNAMADKNQKPFEDEKSALNWFQKTFGLKPMQKESTENPSDEIETLKQDRFIKENEIAQLTLKLKQEQKAKTELQEQLNQLAEEVKELKGQAGDTPAIAPKRTDGNNNPDPARISLPETGSIEEQFAAFTAALDNPEK